MSYIFNWHSDFLKDIFHRLLQSLFVLKYKHSAKRSFKAKKGRHTLTLEYNFLIATSTLFWRDFYNAYDDCCCSNKTLTMKNKKFEILMRVKSPAKKCNVICCLFYSNYTYSSLSRNNGTFKIFNLILFQTLNVTNSLFFSFRLCTTFISQTEMKVHKFDFFKSVSPIDWLGFQALHCPLCWLKSIMKKKVNCLNEFTTSRSIWKNIFKLVLK